MTEPTVPKRRGRPKKENPLSSSELTVSLPTADHVWIERMAVLTGKPPGRLIRHAIETHFELAPLVKRQQRELEEMREMFRQMKTLLRVLARNDARTLRELAEAQDGGANAADESLDGIEPDFSFDGK